MTAITQPIIKSRWQEIKHMWTHEFTALWVLPGVLLGLCVGFVVGWKAQDGITSEGVTAFVVGYLPDILTIGITVTLLYYFDQWRSDKRDEKRLKEELFWQIRSRVTDVAVSALDRLRVNGWLALIDKRNLHEVKWSDANLREVDLSGAKLPEANLRSADLRDANLSGANMESANLSGADLWDANLSGARMGNANLSDANMALADLSGADMWGVNLSGAFMRNANLSGARMGRTNLSGADLRDANLSGANMEDANLSGADMEDAKFDEQTLLPNETYWTAKTDMARFTNPDHPQFWRSDDPNSLAYRGDNAVS